MFRKNSDVEKEIEKFSRKTNRNFSKSENAFENRLNQLENDIDKSIKSREKLFDESKKSHYENITADYTDSSIKRYREKLDKI